MKPTSTVAGIQYLRGLAALLVVVDHAAAMISATESSGRAPAAFLFYGAVGVPVFFVISGFIIVVVSLDRSLNSRLKISEFYYRRFVRIVPFMWVCVIGYNLIRLTGTGRFDWDSFLRAMFLWPVGAVSPNVIWTLRHEAAFYLLFGLTILGSVRRPQLLVFWFVSPVLLWILELAVPETLQLMPAAIQELVRFLANVVNLDFGAGFVLGLLYVMGNRALRPRFHGGFLLAVIASSAEFGLLALIMPEWNDLSTVVAVSVVSAGLVWLGTCLRPSTGLISRFGKFLGDASYSIYLVHVPAGLIFLTAIAKLHLGGNFWAIWGSTVIVAMLVGSAVHVFVERPVLKLAGKLLRPHWQLRRTGVAG